MIRKIMVPIRGDGKGENVLRHAMALARRFSAHIEAVHCRPRAEDLLPFGVPIPTFLRDQMTGQAREVADAEEARLRGLFDALVASSGLTRSDKPVDGAASIAWFEEAGKQVDVIKSHGRLCDFIVVAKPDRDRNLGANTLKTALFNVGRPVLMCPPQESAPTTLGARAAIAWNGSLEATRAVALTLDLIKKADQVSILSVGGSNGGPGDADAFKDYLALHGVSAEIRRASISGSAGATLLQEAKSAGADMLIMGAYGDSHERETLFGGNTQVVVDTSTMPVALVH